MQLMNSTESYYGHRWSHLLVSDETEVFLAVVIMDRFVKMIWKWMEKTHQPAVIYGSWSPMPCSGVMWRLTISRILWSTKGGSDQNLVASDVRLRLSRPVDKTMPPNPHLNRYRFCKTILDSLNYVFFNFMPIRYDTIRKIQIQTNQLE